MADKYDIVVYGMNGYTGKMIAEYLTKRGLPFIAAGRNEKKLKEALASVPGDHKVEIRAVEHNEKALSELFKGRKIVANVVGPFGQLAEPVVRAAYANGCHYLDTTGEGDYFLKLRANWGKKFEDKGLACISACSYMWVAGMIAAEIALEDPRVDSLEILYAPRATPTPASTKSFLRMINLPQYYKQDHKMVEWAPGSHYEVVVPGRHMLHAGFPWGGGFEPMWLENDERVRNCQVLVTFPKGPIIDFVVDKMNEYRELAKTKSQEEMEEITNQWGQTMTDAAYGDAPPKEVPEVNHNILSVWARGTTTGKQHIFYTTSPYLQTGALVAEAAKRILNGQLLQAGCVPATKAFGHRALLATLAEEGLHCWA